MVAFWVFDIVACLNWVYTCFWQFLDKMHYLCLVYPCSIVNIHLWTFCIPQYSQSYMLRHLLTSWNSKVINNNYIQYMLKNYGWAPEKYPSTEVTRLYYSFVYSTVMSISYNYINVLSIFIYAVFVHAQPPNRAVSRWCGQVRYMSAESKGKREFNK